MNNYLHNARFVAIFGIVFLFSNLVFSQEQNKASINFPGIEKEIFEASQISLEDQYEFGASFNKNYDELFIGVRLNKDWKAEIRNSNFKNNEWSIPERLNLDTSYTYNDPYLNEKEDRLYFVSNMPMDGLGEPKDFDIWYMEKTDTGWSKPINCGNIINSNKDEFYVSISDNGSLYFVSNSHTKGEEDRWDFDIYYCQFTEGKYQEPVRLNNIVNSTSFECDPYIAADESYLIFCSTRPGGLGEGDLYISYKDKEGKWMSPQNMGNKINTEFHEFCPMVTKDGMNFLFTSNGDIYWVSSKILSK